MRRADARRSTMRCLGPVKAGRDGAPATHRRRGIATVEFAVIMPLLLILILGIWELGRMVEVRQLLENASREGGRQAAAGKMTNAEVTGTDGVVLTYLKGNGINITGATCSLANKTAAARSNPNEAQQLDHYQLTLTLPFNNVKWAFVNRSMTGVSTITVTTDWYSMRDKEVTVTQTVPL